MSPLVNLGADIRLTRLVRLAVFAASLCASVAASAQSLEPIRYTVSFPAPHTHYAEIEALYPTDGRPHIDLMMAVWTPGSYLIREYARHVEALTASDPERRRLPMEKTRKNRWRVVTNGARMIRLRYRVFAHEMSVRTNWVDEEFALLNGAPTFITLLESPSRRAHEVRIVLPGSWAASFSGLTPGAGDDVHIAADYDTLVDSPIVAGSPSVYAFKVQGTPHYLVNFRERGVWNGPQAVQDLARLSHAVAAFWGGVPFERFYFFNIIGSARNGLEHKNSAVLNTPLDTTSSREAYLQWLSLASHEYFHAWNGKRLRPAELGPFDYENEVYTRSLWFVEGLADYYGELMLARAGVATREEFLGALSDQIRDLQSTPGRFNQSVETASYDAWIKYYRPDENSPNSAISYYVKGAVIGFVLDTRLRKLSGGTKSLDDVMRAMAQRFSGETGFSSEELRSVILEVAGPAHEREMRGWLQGILETTVELDYDEALEWFGLRMTAPALAPRPWLGVTTRVDNQKTVVSGIRRGSPASAAGLSLLDEIVAVNGAPVPAGTFADHVARLTPGATATLTITRAGTTRQLEVVPGTDPAHGWSLSMSPAATEAQREHLAAWLGK